MSTREERFYEQAVREVTDHQLSPGVWGKAFSLAIGDEQKAKALYMKLRAEQLEREYRDTVVAVLRESWADIKAGRRFVCPFCQAQATARREQGFWSLPGKYRYYCHSCNTELSVSDASFNAHPSGSAGEKRNNPMAVTGFVLGLFSVLFYAVGVVPILAVVFSGIGLASFKPEAQKNKWMAGSGLALGVLYTVMMLNHYGHLPK